MKGKTPLVSIVTATYKSGGILGYAIKSVIEQDVEDWELIIVGDHCTDDTDSLVNSFGDERIRFINLSENSGQQAKPNNVGVSQARGHYLCFLNQDDMYLPCHLSFMMTEFARSSCDILCARYASVQADTPLEDGLPIRASNGGATPQEPAFTPMRWQIASSWFMPLDVAREVGEWRMEDELHVTPSQEWLFRADRLGKKLACCQRVTLVALPTTWRRTRSPVLRKIEHEYVYHRLVASNPSGAEIEKQLEFVDLSGGKSIRGTMRGLYNKTFAQILAFLGIHPKTLEMMIRFGGKGEVVRRTRVSNSSNE